MSYNGSGLFQINSTGQPVVANTLIEAATFNAFTADVATGLSTAIANDGQTTITANLPMAGFKHTGVGDANARTQYTSAGQTQDGKLNWVDGGGTADAITATYSPAITALVDGQLCYVRATAANATTTPTFSPNGLTARTIVKGSGAALVAGDIPGDQAEIILRYDLANTRWALLNPYIPALATTATTVSTTVESGATGTTQAAGDNSTKIATTAYADRVKSKLHDVDATVAANALTLTIGAQVLDFRSTTLTDGTPVTRSISSPITMTVSSGSTLGTTSAVQSEIAILAIDNAGTVEVACVNISGGNDLSETGLITTIAEGGVGGADSATVFYSTTARTSVAYRVVGRVTSTQATAGTWATTPSLVQGAGGNALTAMSSLGYGQTWQIVTGSRTSGTTYYNTTGKPIQVSVTANFAAGCGVSCVVDGNNIAYQYTSVAGAQVYPSASFIVPARVSYSVTATTIGTFYIWAELR